MKDSPPIGVCTGLENSEALTRVGVDFVEVNVQNFLVPQRGDATFAPHRAAAAAPDLPIACANCFLPGDLPCVGPAVNESALLAYVDEAFARAQTVGIGCIVFGSGGARNVPEGFSREQARAQFVSLLKKLAPLAQRSAVTVVIEPLNDKECNFINTLAEGAELVEACGHGSVQLLADTYHMGFSGEGPETVRQFGPLIRHFHVAEYPSRRFPGADGSSQVAFFEVLRGIDYQGRISVECHWGTLADEVGQAVANVRSDLAAAGY